MYIFIIVSQVALCGLPTLLIVPMNAGSVDKLESTTEKKLNLLYLPFYVKLYCE